MLPAMDNVLAASALLLIGRSTWGLIAFVAVIVVIGIAWWRVSVRIKPGPHQNPPADIMAAGSRGNDLP
jgi:hypothetical protein